MRESGVAINIISGGIRGQGQQYESHRWSTLVISVNVIKAGAVTARFSAVYKNVTFLYSLWHFFSTPAFFNIRLLASIFEAHQASES